MDFKHFHIYWLILFASVNAESVRFKDCGSKGRIKEIQVSPCPKQPCVLHKGKNVTIQVDFITDNVVVKATAQVFGVIAGEKVRFPIEEPNCCKNQGLRCPLKAQTLYNYKTFIPVSKEYPTLDLVVIWRMIDQLGNDVFCWEIPVRLR